MAEAEPPFYTCLKDVDLNKDMSSDSETLRTLKADEVLELLAGPQQEKRGSVMRMKVKFTHDEKSTVGWFTVKDQKGTECTEKDETLYTCSSTAAITDTKEIKDCKVIKKMLAGDTFVILESPFEEAGMTRVKGKSTKGDVEGWITIKGNAGTTYAKLTNRSKVTRATPIQQKFNTDSPEVRTLEAGEFVEVMEGPKEEKLLAISRIQVRTSTDRAVGWISLRAESVQACA